MLKRFKTRESRARRLAPAGKVYTHTTTGGPSFLFPRRTDTPAYCSYRPALHCLRSAGIAESRVSFSPQQSRLLEHRTLLLLLPLATQLIRD